MPKRIPEPDYPATAQVRRVRSNGEIKWQGGFIYISSAIIADRVAIIEIDNDVFEVRFYDRPIGRLETNSDKLKPIPKTPNIERADPEKL